MATAVKRPGAATAAPAAVDNRVNFGASEFYTAGGGAIPEGKYCLFFDAVVHQYEKTDGQKAGPEFLAIRVAAYALDAPSEDPKVGYYSMGRKAILSFLPNPDDEGKSLLAVPNGPATTLNEMSNWAIFRKSLMDCAMPEGVFTNDLRAIDGVWVQIANIPEPEQRKQMGGSVTGDAQPEPRKNQSIAVVTEILEGGAPWEGGGGMPEEKPKAKVVGKIPARPAAAPARTAPTRQAPAPSAAEVESTDDDLLSAAQTAAGSVIEGSADGVAKLVLRTGTFKAATKVNGGEMAQRILDTYFKTDETLNALLGDLGYQVQGPRVVPLT